MITQALILAGGLGSRLGGITRDTPKPMVPVGDRPFLEWLILMLRDYGISRFVLCVGYLAEKIESHFGDGKKFGCDISYSVEKDLLGTGGAIKKAAPLLGECFFVLSGDNYLRFDYADYVASYRSLNALGMLALWTNDPPLYKRNVKLDVQSSRILAYDFNDPAGKNFVDIGVKLFSRALFDYFPEKDRFSLELDVMPRLAASGKLYGYPVARPNLDVGTPYGLEKVRGELLNES